MGRLPKDLEEKRLRLLKVARRGAFDSYIRRGRVPDLYGRIADAASEAKALSTDVSLPVAAPLRPAGRPTTHYVWRTAGDNRVRGAHAALDGQIFAWDTDNGPQSARNQHSYVGETAPGSSQTCKP